MRYIYNKNDLYKRDIIIIKKYNDKYYKLFNLNFKRNKGYEEIKKEVKLEQLEFNFEDKKKEDCNLARARSKVFEIAMCNNFFYFCTFTLDKNKYNRHDFDFFYTKFRDFIKYMNKKYNISLKFLIVPEKHKDGSWHMHALFNKDLEKIIIKNEYNYLDIPEYRDRFGFCNIQKIIDIEITTKYLLKYICKDIDKNITTLNKHVYFCSRNLKRATKIYENFNIYNIDYDFQNQYCKQKAYKKLSDLEAELQIKL